ncbi:NB-ARC domain-containing protein [Streptomyces roseifaciens]|uniref:NB-ARC domain-containing protein n=1 Tax=Streptomyces roseifaciens TaxID=1488406 RepID=UPI0007C84131|nr:NB-ARC domain-containing protein [Streptomyces roseifaciens]
MASVLGGGAGIVALLVGLGYGPNGGAVSNDPPPPPPPAIPEWVVDRAEAEQVVAAVCAQAGVRAWLRSRAWLRFRSRGHRHGQGRGQGQGKGQGQGQGRDRGRHAAVGITTGLHGAGGFGKTTLAHMVCAHPKVRRAFRGRVYVVTVGRNVRSRAAIAAKVAEATRFITGDTLESGDDPGRAGDHLGRLLAQRPRTLLVIDDVWEPEQLEPFLRGAQDRCVRLVTTRKPAALPPQAIRAVVDRMSPAQARAVLTYRLDPALPEPLVEALIKATGRWALLLRLVNQLIVVQAATGMPAGAVAQAILERLRALGPAGADPQPDRPLDLDDSARRNTAVRASVRAATALLPHDGGRRFAELGIFAEDEVVPLPLVALLWRATGGLAEPDARALCAQMADLSLLRLDGSVDGGTIALHDVVRDYLRAELAADRAGVNRAFLDAVATRLQPVGSGGSAVTTVTPAAEVAWWQTTDGYLQDHLIEHLLEAGWAAEAEALAGDLRWVQARLGQRGPTSVWRDLDQIDRPIARTRARDVARAAHLLSPTDPPHALGPVLRSRLTALPQWSDQPHAALHPTLANRWPPPDLPDPSLLRTLTGSTGEVRTVAFSPDGAVLATADDEQVRLWNPVTGAALHTLSGNGRVRALAFSPDGTLLATADGDGRVRLWDPVTGAAVQILGGHEGLVRAVAFSADDDLVTIGEDRLIRRWDPATSHARPTGDRISSGRVRVVALGPDAVLLAAADGEGRVTIWSDPTDRVVRSLPERVPGVRAMAFSPDGALLATAGEDRRVRLWNAVTGAALHTLTGHVGYVNALAFSPDGALLASAGYDQAVRLWDPVTGAAVRTVTGHEGYVNALAFSPDGALLATAGSDRAVRLRDPAADTFVGGAMGVREVAVAAGSWLATTDDDGGVRLRDPATGAPLRTLTDYIRGAYVVAFRPVGAMLATVGEDGQMWLWDRVTGMPSGAFPEEGVRDVQAVAFSPDGTVLAVANSRGVVDLWDLPGCTVRRTLPAGGALRHVRAMAFSPDGGTLATVDDQGSAALWNLAAGTAGRALTHHSIGALQSVAFSPDGTMLATVSSSGTVHIWDPGTGAVLRPLLHREGRATALAFSGRRLATVSEDGTLRIWDPSSGAALTLMRTDSPLRCCAWSADGRVLFAGGRGGLFGYDYHPGASSF